MFRTRAYTRKMRAKHIKRKKMIVSHWHWFETDYYPHIGMYSKNKIHCSCRMCRSKDYNGRHILTLQELRAINKFKDEIECLRDQCLTASMSVFQTEGEGSNPLSRSTPH